MYQISDSWLSLLLSLCTSGVCPIRSLDQPDRRWCWKFCLKTTHRYFGSEGEIVWMNRFLMVTLIFFILFCTLKLLQWECSNILKLLLYALFDKTKLCTSDVTSDWPKEYKINFGITTQSQRCFLLRSWPWSRVFVSTQDRRVKFYQITLPYLL